MPNDASKLGGGKRGLWKSEKVSAAWEEADSGLPTDSWLARRVDEGMRKGDVCTHKVERPLSIAVASALPPLFVSAFGQSRARPTDQMPRQICNLGNMAAIGRVSDKMFVRGLRKRRHRNAGNGLSWVLHRCNDLDELSQVRCSLVRGNIRLNRRTPKSQLQNRQRTQGKVRLTSMPVTSRGKGVSYWPASST
jgi:hypothetical protein